MIVVGHTCRHHPGPELYFGGKIKDCNVVSQRLFVPQRVLQHSSNTNVPVEEKACGSELELGWRHTCAPLLPRLCLDLFLQLELCLHWPTLSPILSVVKFGKIMIIRFQS